MTQPPQGRKPLGQWLVEEEVLTQEELQAALTDHRATGMSLGETLISSGRCTPKDVWRCLALQHEMPWVSLRGHPPTPQALALLSGPEARALGVLPLELRGDVGNRSMLVALSAPNQEAATRNLTQRLGMAVEGVLCDPLELQDALSWYEALQAMPAASDDKDQETSAEHFAREVFAAAQARPAPHVTQPYPVPPGLLDEVATLRERVTELEKRLAENRKAVEAQADLRSRVGIVEALLEQILAERMSRGLIPTEAPPATDTPPLDATPVSEPVPAPQIFHSPETEKVLDDALPPAFRDDHWSNQPLQRGRTAPDLPRLPEAPSLESSAGLPPTVEVPRLRPNPARAPFAQLIAEAEASGVLTSPKKTEDEG